MVSWISTVSDPATIVQLLLQDTKWHTVYPGTVELADDHLSFEEGAETVSTIQRATVRTTVPLDAVLGVRVQVADD